MLLQSTDLTLYQIIEYQGPAARQGKEDISPCPFSYLSKYFSYLGGMTNLATTRFCILSAFGSPIVLVAAIDAITKLQTIQQSQTIHYF